MDWGELKNAALSVGKVSLALGRKTLDTALSQLSGIPLSITDTVEVGYRQAISAWHGTKADSLVKQGKYEEAVEHYVAWNDEAVKCVEKAREIYDACQNYMYGDAVAIVNDATSVYQVTIDESLPYMQIESLSVSGGYSSKQMEQLCTAFKNSGYTEEQFTYMVSGGFAHEILLNDSDVPSDSRVGSLGASNTDALNGGCGGSVAGDAALANTIIQGGGNSYSPEQKEIFEERSQEEGHSAEHLALVSAMGIEKTYLCGMLNSRMKVEANPTNTIPAMGGARNMSNGSVELEDLQAVQGMLSTFSENVRELSKAMSKAVEDCQDNCGDDTVSPDARRKVSECVNKLEPAFEKVSELQSRIQRTIRELIDAAKISRGGN